MKSKDHPLPAKPPRSAAVAKSGRALCDRHSRCATKTPASYAHRCSSRGKIRSKPYSVSRALCCKPAQLKPTVPASGTPIQRNRDVAIPPRSVRLTASLRVSEQSITKVSKSAQLGPLYAGDRRPCALDQLGATIRQSTRADSTRRGIQAPPHPPAARDLREPQGLFEKSGRYAKARSLQSRSYPG
jgi:hypothetical protein